MSRTQRERYERYERLKAEWVFSNPSASPEQYQQAMTRLAQECGV